MAIQTSLITNTGANVYTSSGNTAITWMSIYNYGANAQANVHIVPSGESANVQNQIIGNVTITSHDTLQVYTGNEKLILENNTSIYVIANVNSSLNAVTSYMAM